MKERKYKRITLQERYKIESFLQIGKTISEISKLLDKPISTISREIKRGIYVDGKRYFANHADTTAKIKNRVKRIYPKLINNTVVNVCLSGTIKRLESRTNIPSHKDRISAR